MPVTRGARTGDHAVGDTDGRVHDTLGAAGGDWILVRPDGYLSTRGSGEAELRSALARLASLRIGDSALT